MNRQRVVSFVHRPKVAGERCRAPGCSQGTREGKPYCSDHVDHHSYVQDLLAKMSAMASPTPSPA